MRASRMCLAEVISPSVGVYRRPLPESLVSFSSDDGRVLFREAMMEGGCEGYFALAEQFHTQNEPAYCGLGSLAMVLNALNIEDRSQVAKKNIKHLTEESLDVHIPPEVVQKHGITFDEFHCMALLNGAGVVAKRQEDHSYEEFYSDVRRVCTATPTSEAMVVTFSRKYIGQTGSGHFSPLAALHQGSSQALIMDTARFKYPPFWVGVQTMYESMIEADPSTGRSRGWFLLSASRAPSVTGLARSQISWADVHSVVNDCVPREYATRAGRPLADGEVDGDVWVASVLAAIDDAGVLKASLLATHDEALMTADNLRDLRDMEHQIRATPVYAAVARYYEHATDTGSGSAAGTAWPSLELAALLVTAWPMTPKGLTPPPSQQLFYNEVSFIRERLLLMSGGKCSCPLSHA